MPYEDGEGGVMWEGEEPTQIGNGFSFRILSFVQHLLPPQSQLGLASIGPSYLFMRFFILIKINPTCISYL